MKLSIVLLMLISSVCFAQELKYPELNVTPRATARIKIEMKQEAGKAWSQHMAVSLSSISTLVAGAMSGSSIQEEKKEDGGDMAPTIAMAVGGAWLGATAWAAMAYRPYRKAYSRFKKMPYKTKREKLTVERLAEEELSQLRTLGKRIRWFSAVTNLAASGYLMGNLESESDAQIAAGFSALLALGPIFFKYHWEDVANEQDKYKKKIFSPVAMMPIMKNPFSNDRASGVSLLYTF
jgi:hypothetical protein